VIAPPPAPVITSAIDALAVVLNERGAVDLEHDAELLHGDADAVTVTDRIKRRQHGRSASRWISVDERLFQ
jgi:N12 class adenine-specific DNA methylase